MNVDKPVHGPADEPFSAAAGCSSPDAVVPRQDSPAEDLFAISHLGQVQAESDSWRLRIEGLVERELVLSLADLGHFTPARLRSVHHCAGDPMNPTRPTWRVAEVVWEGVWLRDILRVAGIRPQAQYLWSDGMDRGEFAGEWVDFYRKDVPIRRVGDDMMLATRVNDSPLPAPHGGPMRLVVPGYYGTNSVKWLWRLTAARTRAKGLFTTRFYNDRPAGGQIRPVWAMAPASMIVSPVPHSRCTGPVRLRGWAWGEHEITSVEISNDLVTWQPATVERRQGWARQNWSAVWTPSISGAHRLMCRATDAAGQRQPAEGARNAMHTIAVNIL